MNAGLWSRLVCHKINVGPRSLSQNLFQDLFPRRAAELSRPELDLRDFFEPDTYPIKQGTVLTSGGRRSAEPHHKPLPNRGREVFLVGGFIPGPSIPGEATVPSAFVAFFQPLVAGREDPHFLQGPPRPLPKPFKKGPMNFELFV